MLTERSTGSELAPVVKLIIHLNNYGRVRRYHIPSLESWIYSPSTNGLGGDTIHSVYVWRHQQSSSLRDSLVAVIQVVKGQFYTQDEGCRYLVDVMFPAYEGL